MSMIFTPFYLPLVGLIALFIFSYMANCHCCTNSPYSYWCTFHHSLPTLLIHLYRRYQGWSLIEMGAKERRMVPYLISILCYFGCYYLMNVFHIPSFMARILVAALVIQVLCALINVWWKISTHGSHRWSGGGARGILVPLRFNPVWWLSFVPDHPRNGGHRRMILRQHSLWQVVCGFLVVWSADSSSSSKLEF